MKNTTVNPLGASVFSHPKKVLLPFISADLKQSQLTPTNKTLHRTTQSFFLENEVHIHQLSLALYHFLLPNLMLFPVLL